EFENRTVLSDEPPPPPEKCERRRFRSVGPAIAHGAGTMKYTRFSLTLTVLLSAAVGCGASSSGRSLDSNDAIIGGRTDTKHVAVGMVGQTDGRSKEIDFGCTGTLIASRTVLTAAHCVRTEANHRVAASRFRFAVADDVFDA